MVHEHLADGIRNPSDPHLEGRAIRNQRRDMGPDLSFEVGWWF